MGEKDVNQDYRVALLTFLGIIGFISGCIIFFHYDLFCKNGRYSIFHEISYEPRIIVDTVLKPTIDSLEKVSNVRQQALARVEKDSLEKSALLRSEMKKDSLILKNLRAYPRIYQGIDRLDTNGFSLLNNSLHFNITQDTLDTWQKKFDTMQYDWLDTAIFFLKNEGIQTNLTGTAIFKIDHAFSDVRFISKYPSAGVWMLLILIFCSFSFIAVATCVYIWQNVRDLVNQVDKKNKISSYFLLVVASLITLLFLSNLWAWTFYDEDPIKDIFFLKSLSVSLNWIIGIGYIAGSFCLGGFVYTAGLLSLFAHKFKAKQDPNLQAAVVESGKNGPRTRPEIPTNEKAQIDRYIEIRNYFNTYFILSSIILSLMVLCTGGLYTTVNSLDFIKLIVNDWGYSPARRDFIYLYGGLHTVILLLFYLPAKMRFSEINKIKQDTLSGTIDGARLSPYFKGPLNHFKEALIATSPLLASLVQGLLENLFQ